MGQRPVFDFSRSNKNSKELNFGVDEGQVARTKGTQA